MKSMMRSAFLLLTMLLPWPLKRMLLCRVLGFRIEKDARIGLSWLGMRHLEMGEGSRIGHLNVFKGVDRVVLGPFSAVGRLNLFTAVPTSNRRHFQHLSDRRTEFTLGRHARVTMRHLFDCNASITIGEFTTIAGYSSQYLTHSIDVVACRQDAHPVRIGSYCFVGTRCLFLGGSEIPDYSVVAAGSVVRTAFTEVESLYAGVPATFRKKMPPETKYWARTDGWID